MHMNHKSISCFKSFIVIALSGLLLSACATSSPGPAFDASSYAAPTERWQGQLSQATFVTLNIIRAADGTLSAYGQSGGKGDNKSSSDAFEITAISMGNQRLRLTLSGENHYYEASWNSYEQAWVGALFDGKKETLLALRRLDR